MRILLQINEALSHVVSGLMELWQIQAYVAENTSLVYHSTQSH
jgi:hypothetical protein